MAAFEIWQAGLLSNARRSDGGFQVAVDGAANLTVIVSAKGHNKHSNVRRSCPAFWAGAIVERNIGSPQVGHRRVASGGGIGGSKRLCCGMAAPIIDRHDRR